MRRISIKSMMLYVSFIAVGLAALRNANDAWSGVILLLVILSLGSALLGVMHQRGRDRAWWQGFALFLGSYLILAFGPWFWTLINPIMGTSQLFKYLSESVTPRSPSGYDSSEN